MEALKGLLKAFIRCKTFQKYCKALNPEEVLYLYVDINFRNTNQLSWAINYIMVCVEGLTK